MLSKNTFLGVGITNETNDDILEYLLQRLKIDKKFYIVTPNPEILVYANSHKYFKNILNSAEISLADGAGLFLASIFMGKPLQQRIPGVDFIDFICKNTVRNPISMGFLGGKGKVAEKTAECLKKKYPHLDIVFIGEEWPEDFSSLETRSKIKDLRSNNTDDKKNLKSYLLNPKPIDLLFVAFGHPKQEEWIYKNLDNIPVKAAMGVGGAFDYISGGVTRAPLVMRALGLEWLFRLVREPWRWKRQLALVEFIKLVYKEKLGKTV